MINPKNDYKIEVIPRWMLIKKAKKNYRKITGTGVNSNTWEYQTKLCVNFLRHQMPIHKKALSYLDDNRFDDYIMIMKNIFKIIGEEYPSMKKECQRQLSQKWDYIIFRKSKLKIST